MSALTATEVGRVVSFPAPPPLSLVVTAAPRPDLVIPTGKAAMLLYALCHPNAGALEYVDFLEAGEVYRWGWRGEADGTMQVVVPHNEAGGLRAIARARQNPRALLELVAVLGTAPGSLRDAAALLYAGNPSGRQLSVLKDWLALLRNGTFSVTDRSHRPEPGPLLLEDGAVSERLFRGRWNDRRGTWSRQFVAAPWDALQVRERPSAEGHVPTAAETARIRLAGTVYSQWGAKTRGGRGSPRIVQPVTVGNLVRTWAGLRPDRFDWAVWHRAVVAELTRCGQVLEGSDAPERRAPERRLLRLQPARGAT